MDSSTQKLKDMIQRMTELDSVTEDQKQQLDEMASFNVSADTADEVTAMLKMLNNAGMNDAKPVSQDMMPMRQDMERLAGIMGDPEGPEPEGPATVVGDTPMSAPDAEEGDSEQDMEEDTSLAEWSREDATELEKLHGLAMSAAAGDRRAAAQFEDHIDNNFADVDSSRLREKLKRMDKDKQIEVLHNLIRDGQRIDKGDDYTSSSMRAGELQNSSYDNAPDEDHQDTEYMTKDLSGGLNRRKKSYADAEDGDNPMAVENIRDRLYAKLSEKKAKPDFADIDGDGDKKEPMKKAAKDKKAKKK